MRSQLPASIVGFTFCVLITFGCIASNSDKSILRAEFNVPKEATVVSYKAHPELPETPQVGLFQCRSAGDNIMYAPKTIHTRLDHDLNDFMLAILDHERKQIVIQVNTSY